MGEITKHIPESVVTSAQIAKDRLSAIRTGLGDAAEVAKTVGPFGIFGWNPFSNNEQPSEGQPDRTQDYENVDAAVQKVQALINSGASGKEIAEAQRQADELSADYGRKSGYPDASSSSSRRRS